MILDGSVPDIDGHSLLGHLEVIGCLFGFHLALLGPIDGAFGCEVFVCAVAHPDIIAIEVRGFQENLTSEIEVGHGDFEVFCDGLAWSQLQCLPGHLVDVPLGVGHGEDESIVVVLLAVVGERNLAHDTVAENGGLLGVEVAYLNGFGDVGLVGLLVGVEILALVFVDREIVSVGSEVDVGLFAEIEFEGAA